MSDVVWVDVGDGQQAALTHHAGPGEPVVLCHGISSNARFWDLAPDRSLADWLVAQGYDVWNLDLRGHGLAERDQEGHRQKAGLLLGEKGGAEAVHGLNVTRMTPSVKGDSHQGHFRSPK